MLIVAWCVYILESYVVSSPCEMKIFRRIKLLFDKRGDDASVMDDPILVGFTPNNSESR